MVRVAEAAGLPAGTAPTRTQYTEHAPKLGITLSVSAIGRAYRTWGDAQRTFEDGVRPVNARPVTPRQSFAAHRERTPVEHLDLLQEWSRSAGKRRKGEYDRWRWEYGPGLVAAGKPLPLSAQQLLKVFPGLFWDDILALDPSSEDLPERVRAGIERRLANTPNPLGLVTVPETAGLLRRMATEVTLCLDKQAAGFPIEVMRLGTKGTRLLLLEDVQEYMRTGRARSRPFGQLQDAAYTAAQVAKFYGVTRDAMVKAETHRTRLPPADGRAGPYLYWLRSTIESWTRPR
jgi:hypothetical protein